MVDFEGLDSLRLFRGKQEYGKARFKAFLDVVRSLLLGQPVELLSFNDAIGKLRLTRGMHMGIHDVPLDRIVGSVNKHDKFTRRFFPTKRVDEERWSHVYARVTSTMGVPPVDLYKVGDVYFVADGNHRVSIARQMGNKTIEAYVTQFMSKADVVAA